MDSENEKDLDMEVQDDADKLLEDEMAGQANKPKKRLPGLSGGCLGSGSTKAQKAAKVFHNQDKGDRAKTPAAATPPSKAMPPTAAEPDMNNEKDKEEAVSCSSKNKAGSKKKSTLDSDMASVAAKHMKHGGTSSKALEDLTLEFFFDDSAAKRNVHTAKIRGV